LTDKPLHTIAFVKAVKTENRAVIEDYSARVVPMVTEYLMVALKANKFHAEECSHHAFSVVLDRIKNNSIDDQTSVVSYLVTTARNQYFNMLKNEIREGSAILQEQYYQDSEEQIQSLLDEERTKILEQCLGNLDEKARVYIQYVMKHSDYSMLKIGKIFGISPENARTKKSRIVRQLSDCVRKKLNR
jgi:RNA polymerase sigma factor (sigma-70 family)